jgi:hypothetical protein
LSFLARTASAHPDVVAIMHGKQRITSQMRVSVAATRCLFCSPTRRRCSKPITGCP